MKIAIQSADLDADRIDGTRVYLLNLLRLFGALQPDDEFYLYHKRQFNPLLAPPIFPNYKIKEVPFPFFWTQTRFAWELMNSGMQKLWMPVQALPMMLSKKIQSTVTIHDLAFKIYPEMFPSRDLFRLNLYADYAIWNADKLIAVSAATKKDILRFYPAVPESKIKTIHHGFDGRIFSNEISKSDEEEFRERFNLSDRPYLLYVGAIQPRKDLESLVEAFSILKKEMRYSAYQLVIVGAPAWQAEKTLDAIGRSPFVKDILLTGKVSFSDLPKFYQSASVFVFPELYSGFGIPLLEAFASGVPVIAADNPALREVGGDRAIFFECKNAIDLAEKIKQVLENENLRAELVALGQKRVRLFSWEKCARETLEYIKA